MTKEKIQTEKISELIDLETKKFQAIHLKSFELHKNAEKSFIDGVPMNWMVNEIKKSSSVDLIH
jgi:hypothetical protein